MLRYYGHGFELSIPDFITLSCPLIRFLPCKSAMSSFSSLTFALQALLHRHESYMAEAEEDRRKLHDNIETLEREKREVEAQNARIVEENRNLLDEL